MPKHRVPATLLSSFTPFVLFVRPTDILTHFLVVGIYTSFQKENP